jgi:hypothetical protein
VTRRVRESSGRDADGIVPLMLQRDYTVSMPTMNLSFAAIPAARPCTLPALCVGSLSRVLRMLQLSLS